MRGTAIAKVLLVAGVAIGCLAPGTVFAQWFVTDPVEPYSPVPRYKTPLLFEPPPKPTLVTDPIEPHYPVHQYKTGYVSVVWPVERPWDPFWDFPDYPWLPKGVIAPLD
jgi:hypothetical protein